MPVIAYDARLAGYLQVRRDPPGEAMARELCAEAEGLLRLRRWSERLTLSEFGRVFDSILGQSKDFRRRTEGAQAVWLFAATLGPDLERRAAELLREGRSAAGYLLDRLGSFLVEQEIRALDREARVVEERRGLSVGRRFSPGYGDIPLAAQTVFLERATSVLPELTLSAEYVMKPEKTVTAFKPVFAG